MTTEILPTEERTEILDRAVATYVKHGYKVELNDGRRAIVAKRQQINMLLAFLLTIVTGGLWLVILLVRLANWPVDRVVLTIDRYGNLVPEFSS